MNSMEDSEDTTKQIDKTGEKDAAAVKESEKEAVKESENTNAPTTTTRRLTSDHDDKRAAATVAGNNRESISTPPPREPPELDSGKTNLLSPSAIVVLPMKTGDTVRQRSKRKSSPQKLTLPLLSPSLSPCTISHVKSPKLEPPISPISPPALEPSKSPLVVNDDVNLARTKSVQEDENKTQRGTNKSGKKEGKKRHEKEEEEEKGKNNSEKEDLQSASSSLLDTDQKSPIMNRNRSKEEQEEDEELDQSAVSKAEEGEEVEEEDEIEEDDSNQQAKSPSSKPGPGSTEGTSTDSSSNQSESPDIDVVAQTPAPPASFTNYPGTIGVRIPTIPSSSSSSSHNTPGVPLNPLDHHPSSAASQFYRSLSDGGGPASFKQYFHQEDGAGGAVKRYLCQRCLNHGEHWARKGHKPWCRWAQCDCNLCKMVDERRRLNNAICRHGGGTEDERGNGDRKIRNPMCARCSAHGLQNRLRGHKKRCPYSDCQCNLCKLVDERRDLMAKQIKLRRQQKAEISRGTGGSSSTGGVGGAASGGGGTGSSSSAGSGGMGAASCDSGRSSASAPSQPPPPPPPPQPPTILQPPPPPPPHRHHPLPILPPQSSNPTNHHHQLHHHHHHPTPPTLQLLNQLMGEPGSGEGRNELVSAAAAAASAAGAGGGGGPGIAHPTPHHPLHYPRPQQPPAPNLSILAYLNSIHHNNGPLGGGGAGMDGGALAHHIRPSAPPPPSLQPHYHPHHHHAAHPSSHHSFMNQLDMIQAAIQGRQHSTQASSSLSFPHHPTAPSSSFPHHHHHPNNGALFNGQHHPHYAPSAPVPTPHPRPSNHDPSPSCLTGTCSKCEVNRLVQRTIEQRVMELKHLITAFDGSNNNANGANPSSAGNTTADHHLLHPHPPHQPSPLTLHQPSPILPHHHPAHPNPHHPPHHQFSPSATLAAANQHIAQMRHMLMLKSGSERAAMLGGLSGLVGQSRTTDRSSVDGGGSEVSSMDSGDSKGSIDVNKTPKSVPPQPFGRAIPLPSPHPISASSSSSSSAPTVLHPNSAPPTSL